MYDDGGGMLRVKDEKLKKPKIDLQDDDFGAVLNCAVRYCIGRQSYMPGLVIGFIRPMLPYISNRTLWCFDRDLDSADYFGDPFIDEPAWKKFHEQVKEEVSKRERT